MTPIDRSPARLSGAASGVAAVVSVAAAGLYSWPALAVGALGGVLVVAGLVRGVRPVVTAGGAGLFAGALVAGIHAAPAWAVLSSVAAAVLAWDVGRVAIDIGAQLGRGGATARIEAVHVAASTGVGALTVGVGYLIYRNATGGQPLSALILLIVAGVLLLTAVLHDVESPEAGGRSG